MSVEKCPKKFSNVRTILGCLDKMSKVYFSPAETLICQINCCIQRQKKQSLIILLSNLLEREREKNQPLIRLQSILRNLVGKI